MDLPPPIQHLQTLELAGGGQVGRAATLPPSRTVTFTGEDGYRFSGELTLPAGTRAGQRLPTVILLHGSGLNDLNQTIPEQLLGFPGGSAVFKQMAERLNAAGYAVLRYNKRGVAAVGPVLLPGAELKKQKLLVSQHDRDALAALDFARAQPEVDAGQVYLLGHSEGTLLASHLGATQPGKVAGLVLIGTVGQSFRDTLHGQLVDRPLAQFAGLMDADKDGRLSVAELETGYRAQGLSLKAQAGAIGLVPQGDGWAFRPELHPDAQGRVSIQGGLRQWLEGQFDFPNVPGTSPEDRAYLSDAQAFGSATDWLRGYKGPVLMLHGAQDTNTTLTSACLAYDALRASGNTQATLKVYAGLGHTLSPTEQGGLLDRFGPVAQQPLDDLVRWLDGQTQRR